MISKEKKSPLMLINLTVTIIILIPTFFLPFIAFASPPPPPPPIYGCAIGGHACHLNRKIDMGLMGSTSEVVNVKKRVNKYEEDLRNVPSGPNPLHHNGDPQKRHKPSP